MKKQDAKFDIAHNSDIKTCSSIIFHSKLYVYSNKNMSFWPACLGTVQAIRNITFTHSREFVWTFSKFIKNYEFRTNFVYKVHLRIRVWIRENKEKFVREFQKFVHEFWRKKVICVQNWTNQHNCVKTEIQRHHLLTIIWLVFKKSIKIISKFSTYNCTCGCQDHSSLVCKLRLFVYLKFSLWPINDVIW